MKYLLGCVTVTLSIAAASCFLCGLQARNRVRAVQLPPPTPLAVWLPEEAEIYPASVVDPGTFSVSLDLKEFQQRFPTSGLVAFHYDDPEEESEDLVDRGRSGYVTIWNAASGSSIFYRTTQPARPPDAWSADVEISHLELEGGKIVAYPQNALAGLPGDFYGGAILSAVSALIVCGASFICMMSERTCILRESPASLPPPTA